MKRVDLPKREQSLEQIRVLHVLEATAGGTMRYMENIADATQGLNLACGFAYGTSRSDSRLTPFLNRIKQEWMTFPVDMRRDIEVVRDLRALIQLRHIIREFRPDIVHTHSSKAGALGRAAASLQLRRSVRLYSPHAIAAPLGSRYLKIEKTLSALTDRFIAVSESERRQIIELDLSKSKPIEVIYPSIDCDYFYPTSQAVARQKLGLDARPIVLALGRLTQQKNPMFFLVIMKALRRLLPNVRGIWVGSGQDETEFRNAIFTDGLQDTVSIVPWVDDVRSYIAAADVFLSTATFESFGYVTAEALSMERPVVASNVTGTSDIMTGELRDWLFEPGDSEDAARMIERLIREPVMAQRLATNGRAMVKHRFSTDNMRESLRSAYSSAMLTANQVRAQQLSARPASEERDLALEAQPHNDGRA